MNKASFPLSEKNALADSLVFIRKNLTEVKAGSKLTARAMTACEEMISLFVDNAAEGAVLQVRFVKTLASTISISAARASSSTLTTAGSRTRPILRRSAGTTRGAR